LKRYLLDTNIYVRANRDRAKAEELIQFYSAFLPFTHLHAAVAQELLAGAVDRDRSRAIHRAYIAPFEARGRVVVPAFGTWKRSGEVIAALVRAKALSPGGLARSFVNDVLLAVSCRELGMTLITANERDFRRIRKVYDFEFTAPWP
jgi:predicted nucleic acid-binding protein